MMKIFSVIDALIEYAIVQRLIVSENAIYHRNRLLESLQLIDYEYTTPFQGDFYAIRAEIIAYAKEKRLIEEPGTSAEDNFFAGIMDLLMPRPSEVTQDFWQNYHISPRLATDRYYQFSKATDYIQVKRLEKNIRWQTKGEMASYDMTINLAKPEKTPEEIERAKSLPQSNYPKCVLCKETVGLSGEGRSPRQNHRIIPLTLGDRNFYFQYSPYSYFNEHCIILRSEHVPMQIDENAIQDCLHFVDQFSHYMIASNTDLPIVGGSILSHNHYQGGDVIFPIEQSASFQTLKMDDVQVEVLNWPLSTIRLTAKDPAHLYEVSTKIMNAWYTYENKELGILPYTGDTRHNAVNLAARKKDGQYILYMVFRNNRTDGKNPRGIFHTKEEYWHIKEENIGIIEVMGIAILPGRLVNEMEAMKEYVLEGKESPSMLKHKLWLDSLTIDRSKDLDLQLKREIGLRFEKVLTCCSVFGCTDSGKEHFLEFLGAIE